MSGRPAEPDTAETKPLACDCRERNNPGPAAIDVPVGHITPSPPAVTAFSSPESQYRHRTGRFPFLRRVHRINDPVPTSQQFVEVRNHAHVTCLLLEVLR